MDQDRSNIKQEFPQNSEGGRGEKRTPSTDGGMQVTYAEVINYNDDYVMV